jgi:biofilm PGA synthesis N-glycosyltransferase PgaC
MVSELMANKKIRAVLVVTLLIVAAPHLYSWLLAQVNAQSSYYLPVHSPFIKMIMIYSVVFMSVLILRYVTLMAYSAMEHLDNIVQVRARTEAGKRLPFISIVVPAYNEGMNIQAAVRSLLELDYPAYEVLVVDDGSSDDTYERARAMGGVPGKCTVKVIRKAKGGKARALNTGISQARGDFILSMDGDTKLSPNTLRDCIRHFDDARVGAVAGNVKVVNRENVITWVQALEYVEGLAMLRKAQSYARVVNIVPGPLGMFRKTALRQVHGYDDDTFAEDCDLTLKLLVKGWHIRYEPAAIAWVESPSRLNNLIKQRYRWTRGILQAIKKHSWALLRPDKAGINGFILWYMLFEGVLWPVSDVLGSAFLVWINLKYGVAILLAFWWLQFWILDVVAAAYCAIVEKEDIVLVAYAIVFCLFYHLFVDVVKIFATLEEVAGIRMSWGKLEREGKL